MIRDHKIAVVIPCYRVKKYITSVIETLPEFVDFIIAVDDCCPEKTYEHLQANCHIQKLIICKHEKNGGVGAATKTGYAKALELRADIVFKVDGDGQMDPDYLAPMAEVIISGGADYVKGNRFFNIESLEGMPAVRLLGNAGLSFINKASSGYWQIMDPTNGYTALHTKVLKYLPLAKINNRYFFESDMLFRLGTLKAYVVDFPMKAIYADESSSSMNISRILFSFPFLHLNNLYRRIFYNYFFRDFNAGSIFFILGGISTLFGLLFGASKWISYSQAALPTPSGTVMLAALPIFIGITFLLAFSIIDIVSTPQKAVHTKLLTKD